MTDQKSFIKTLDRLKVSNLAGRLIRDIERIIPPDAALFISPLLLVPTGEADDHTHLRRFEQRQTIARIKILLLPFYRTTRLPTNE